MVSSFFTFIVQLLGSRQSIGDPDSTNLFQRRLVVGNGSVQTITLCAWGSTEIRQAWIPDSIAFLKGHWKLDSILFESSSHLTRIESFAGNHKIDRVQAFALGLSGTPGHWHSRISRPPSGQPPGSARAPGSKIFWWILRCSNLSIAAEGLCLERRFQLGYFGNWKSHDCEWEYYGNWFIRWFWFWNWNWV
jgi:hypothetical protein